MKIQNAFLSVVIAITACLTQTSTAQQVTYSESFEAPGFLPSGWGQASASINRWSRLSTSTFPSITLGSSGIEFARFQAHQTAANTIQTISLPVLDYRLRGSKIPYVSFYMYRDSLSKLGDSLGIYVNTSLSLTGATHLGTIARYSRNPLPDTQIVNGWYRYSYKIPSSFNGATNYIMFKAIGQAGNNIYLDSFGWDAYPIVCSGKPSGAYITSNPDPICGGTGNATLTLNGAITTYTGVTVAWQYGTTATGPWTAFGGNTVTVPTGTLTISRFYRCILTCSTSTQNDTTNVFVMRVISTPKPTITVTPSPVTYCSGSNPVMLIASGAKNYVWSPATGLNDTKNDTVYTAPFNNTNYTITGTDSQGCTGTTNMTVTVRASPNVVINSADSNICIGDSIRLTAVGGGISQYLWSPGGQTTSGIYAKPIVSANYMVTVKNNFNCSSTANKFIHVKQKPIANFGFSASGNTYFFSDSSKDAATWHWKFGDGNESFKTNPVYTFSGDTFFNVTLIISDPPCANDTFTRSIKGNPAFIRNPEKGHLVVKPNPAEGIVSISFLNLPIYGELNLFDATGRNMGPLKISQGQDCTFVDLTDLPKGIYNLQIMDAGKTASTRILKRQ